MTRITIISEQESVTHISSYDHTITTEIGFDTATFSTVMAERNAARWFEQKLGDKVVVYNDHSMVIWEGFVNEVELVIGGLAIRTGPLTDIGNKVRAAYQTVDYSIVFVPGEARKTDWGYNTESIGRYFTFEHEISIGDAATEEEAELIRNTYLQEFAFPPTSENIALAQSGESYRLTVSCLGYGHLLDRYFYESDEAGYTPAVFKLVDVLHADPDDLFAGNHPVQANGTMVPAWAEGNETALSIIKGLVSYGDEDYGRWIFGVYENRRVSYYPLSTTPVYNISITPSGHQVRTANTNTVFPPELVRPGVVARIVDVLPGIATTGPAAQLGSPTTVLIESVSFSAPATVTITGGRTDTISQKLARLGLGAL